MSSTTAPELAIIDNADSNALSFFNFPREVRELHGDAKQRGLAESRRGGKKFFVVAPRRVIKRSLLVALTA